MPTLSWRSTDGNRSSIAIAKAITTIGAAPENDVVVRDLGLAPYHVQLVFDGKDFSLACIEDGDDFVLNGKKKRRSRLAHQDRFALGRADFVFSMLAESAVRSRESGRGAELAGLPRYLLQRYADEFGSAAKGFSPGAMAAIRRHSWPGNVRELENRIKKAVILCDGSMVGPDDLDLGEETARKGETLAEARERFQRQYILDALEKNGGNRVQTAEELDVDPRTIYRYLEKA